jgi:hypothetical protein
MVINVKEWIFAFLPVWNIFRSIEKRILLHFTNSAVVSDNKCKIQEESSAEKGHGRVTSYIKSKQA